MYIIGKTVYPEYNFIAHDLSKFSSAELEPYTLKFVKKAEDSENPQWKTALEHHYRNNPHHPQVGSQPKYSTTNTMHLVLKYNGVFVFLDSFYSI